MERRVKFRTLFPAEPGSRSFGSAFPRRCYCLTMVLVQRSIGVFSICIPPAWHGISLRPLFDYEGHLAVVMEVRSMTVNSENRLMHGIAVAILAEDREQSIVLNTRVET